MKFFRSKPSAPYDPHLTALTVDQADYLRGLVRQYHAGLPQVVVEGDALRAPQGSRPLHNLAELCRRADPRAWPGLVEHHFRALDGAVDATPQGSDEILRSVYLRLVADDAFPPAAAASFSYVRPVAAGLLEALALDLPEAVRMLDDPMVAEVGLERLRAAGRANLLREPVEYDTAQGRSGAAMHIVTGESMFVASKALVLDELARTLTGRELPPEGALFTVPSRHHLVFHPLLDARAVDAVNDLAAFGLGAYQDNPGPLSPRLYWWHQGVVTSLTVIDDATRSFSVAPPEELMAILRRLHAAGA
ncbi:hypothetical protein [Kitasatospora sp. A2-31]|uniref:hypothetical protein n=1 Tax=Kitasatospora sp. A2-31 TaxID=2916414 RepID=UPI001EED5B64|nr:hypothetical protein [Kitasatospora sp. A2-31]MCG6499290.1 hypothetical protein [Kitasatospora sp. A2-31]